jgi:hypothetical protein
MNSIITIFPYKHYGTWMFDDHATGLCQEAFLAGMPEIIELLTAKAGLQNPEKGFKLTCSAESFPGHQAILKLADEPQNHSGHWYQLDGTDMQGWMCSAMYKYFETAPPAIYWQVSTKQPN